MHDGEIADLALLITWLLQSRVSSASVIPRRIRWK